MAITGQDMVAEADVNELIEEICPLGFGKCNLQVQVPLKSDIKTVDQLCGKKIVTSFEVVSQRFFADLDAKSIPCRANTSEKTVIEYIGGSVEAACALGLADGIVDLVGQFQSHREIMSVELSKLLYCRVGRNNASSWPSRYSYTHDFRSSLN